MGRVRAFEERDIPRVTDLHSRVFPPLDGAARDGGDAYDAYFRKMFLDADWSDGQPSLVYEDGDGELIGFVGAMTRRMRLHDRPIRAVTTSQFMVEPARRARLAGIGLAKALLAGPQDLTLADEATNITRKLWEGVGGATALLYSLYWVRVLRPVEFSVARWGKGGRAPARAWIPLCRAADAVVARLPGSPFRARVPATSGEELDGNTLALCIAEYVRNRALRPEYDGAEATWLLESLARKPGSGALRKVLVRTTAGEIAGWYLYCGHRGGAGEVLQVGGREERIGEVLDHLFAQARRDGMIALVGRLDPRFVDAFSSRHCFFHHRGHWTLVHSRDRELIQAIHRGEAFLTRLEGEWCMRFRVG